MNEELFGDRRRSLEEEFFQRQNAHLLEGMRAKLEAEHIRDAFRTTVGIDDEELLSHLMGLGLTAATISAMTVVPLVAVAWADGKMEEREREQILRDTASLDLSEAARTWLESWLIVRPEESLFETWVEYSKDLAGRLEPTVRTALKATTLARATMVAEAAGGGAYGLADRTSGEERAVLARVEEALGV